MAEFRPAYAHGPITEPFPDVFFVTGGFRIAPGVSIARNMTIVRRGNELSIINSVRLRPEGEAELERLGKVAHVLRIGAFHGADDPYYVDRYKPTLWAPPGTEHLGGLVADRELVPGSCPIEGARVFAFSAGKKGEVAILLDGDGDGGVLVSCDSYQNWTTFDGCSLLGKAVMRMMGFGPTLIGGPWVKMMGPGIRADFDRLLDEPFSHLLPGHGTVLRNLAKDGLRTAIAHRFRA